MKWKDVFDKWGLKTIKLNAKFAELEFQPEDVDKDAAWKLYVELITRVSTQTLLPEEGDEETALTSIYELFGITREILKEEGRECIEFTKLAVIVLNQVIRPFTAKWHRLSLQGAFNNKERCDEFRKELADLQIKLRNYTKLLAEVAQVEDLTDITEEA